MGLDNPIHLALILMILLLVFGAKRLPEMGRSLGDGLRGFKDAVSGETTHDVLRASTAAPAEPESTPAEAAAAGQQAPAETVGAAAAAGTVATAGSRAAED